MEWLKVHEYLAAWLALPLMTILAIIQGVKNDGRQVGMARMTIYFGFVTSLAATLMESIDPIARGFAGVLAGFLAIVVTVHAWEEIKATHPRAGSSQ